MKWKDWMKRNNLWEDYSDMFNIPKLSPQQQEIKRRLMATYTHIEDFGMPTKVIRYCRSYFNGPHLPAGTPDAIFIRNWIKEIDVDNPRESVFTILVISYLKTKDPGFFKKFKAVDMAKYESIIIAAFSLLLGN